MALDKTKRILVESDFTKDPLAASNMLMKQKTSQSLPIISSDVMLDKNQGTFFSFQYVLKNLLENDKFISEYFDKTKNKLSGISIDSLVHAFDYNAQSKDYPEEDDLCCYNEALKKHIKDFHTSPAVSLSSIDKQYLNSDCLNIDIKGAKLHGFQKYSPNILKSEDQDFSQTISNDFVIKTEFDDSPTVTKPTNYITVSISNHSTGNVFRSNLNSMSNQIKNLPTMNDVKYIYKEWLSGLKELYIYVPTTFTFYNEEPSDDLKDKVTFIKVKINNRHFPINRIYNVQICGQSLPLLIHKDKFDYYNDTIQPSIVRTIGLSDSEKQNVRCAYDLTYNNFTFYFCCYGTDAQAIKLIYD